MQSKTLLLLRHAKAERDLETLDWLRPLKKRGIRAAKHMGLWLVAQNLHPELIISSPAIRTLSTAQRVCQSMGRDSSSIIQDERIYDASVASLLQVIQECPANAQSLLLVGHNPGLEALLTHLLPDPPPESADGKLLPTAALAHLQLTKPWAKIGPCSATLIGITRVKDIAAQFD